MNCQDYCPDLDNYGKKPDTCCSGNCSKGCGEQKENSCSQCTNSCSNKTSNIEITAVKAEVSKLEMKTGDTLMITFTSNTISNEDMAALSEKFKEQFPNNKIILFLLQPGDKVESTVIRTEETEPDGEKV
jgi:hypothetical protein